MIDHLDLPVRTAPLTAIWVPVRGPDGREHLEMRWSVVPDVQVPKSPAGLRHPVRPVHAA